MGKAAVRKIALIGLAIFAFGLRAGVASAHQPQLVTGLAPVTVTEPEISKAYYDELTGQPRVYHIVSNTSFVLFVQITVPKSSNPEGRYEADIYRLAGNSRTEEAKLLPNYYLWSEMYEPFGGDVYYEGPIFKQRVEAGTYDVEISGNGNKGKYALAIGDTESFTLGEALSAAMLIPTLKSDFFNESPFTFVASIFGSIYLALFLLLGLLLGFVYRYLLKRYKVHQHGTSAFRKNIGLGDRVTRVGAGIFFLGWALLTTWNPLLIIIAGFCFYEALAGWCALYAALGKNTCPV